MLIFLIPSPDAVLVSNATGSTREQVQINAESAGPVNTRSLSAVGRKKRERQEKEAGKEKGTGEEKVAKETGEEKAASRKRLEREQSAERSAKDKEFKTAVKLAIEKEKDEKETTEKEKKEGEEEKRERKSREGKSR